MNNLVEIDWASNDGSRPRYKASTIHGWLVKMRGTLIGNENTRQAGRREMKEARAIRAYRRQREKSKLSPVPSRGGGFQLIHVGRSNKTRAGDRHAVPLPRRDISRSHRHRSERERPPGPSRHQSERSKKSGKSGRSGHSSRQRSGGGGTSGGGSQRRPEVSRHHSTSHSQSKARRDAPVRRATARY